MIDTDITIPPEAEEAATKAYASGLQLTQEQAIAAAIRAAINAWPEMALDGPVTANGRWVVPPVIVLPLPQEKSND